MRLRESKIVGCWMPSPGDEVKSVGFLDGNIFIVKTIFNFTSGWWADCVLKGGNGVCVSRPVNKLVLWTKRADRTDTHEDHERYGF